MIDFIFLLITVQNLLPPSLNCVLINAFSRFSCLWAAGDRMLRIAEQSWLRGYVAVIWFVCL